MSQAETTNPPSVPSPVWGVERYGKYHLVRKLAEGGMAEIFLAKQVGPEGFERDVVVKRMLADLTRNSDFVTMFLDEARLAARLHHHNVCQIHELGQAEGHYFICMEYLAGEDFSTILRGAAKKREYVPFSIVARIVVDAALGLHYAHEFTDSEGKPLNVVHRDISPSNIFVTFEGHVKLLDFGIAKAESRVSRTSGGQLKGKYMYMAPEQARGKPADRRADIFSLGINLYEALTRTRPFHRQNTLAIIDALQKCEFKPPRELRPSIPAPLEAVVLKAMTSDLESRYQTARDFANDLEDALGANLATGAQVAQYVRELFGPERVQLKTRVPTLTQILKEGGLVLPESPKTDGGGHPSSAPVRTPSVDQHTASQASPAAPAPAPSPVPPTGLRRPLIIGAAAVALVLAGAGVASLLRSEPAAAPAASLPVPSPSVLAIASEPPGALITVDGIARGRAPVRIEHLLPGEHTVLATLEGHEPVERSSRIERVGDRLTLVLSLPPLPPPAPPAPPPEVTEVAAKEEPKPAPHPVRKTVARGKLNLDTEPWTRVYLGKKKLGETPLLGVALPAGTHLLRFVNEEKGINTSVELEIEANKTTAKKLRF